MKKYVGKYIVKVFFITGGFIYTCTAMNNISRHYRRCVALRFSLEDTCKVSELSFQSDII